MEESELELIRWKFRHALMSRVVENLLTHVVGKNAQRRESLAEYLFLLREQMRKETPSAEGYPPALAGLLLDERAEQLEGVFRHLASVLEKS